MPSFDQVPSQIEQVVNGCVNNQEPLLVQPGNYFPSDFLSQLIYQDFGNGYDNSCWRFIISGLLAWFDFWGAKLIFTDFLAR